MLEQENGLYNYVNEVMVGEAILLFLYRNEDLSKAIAIYVCRKLLNVSFPMIGEIFNGRDNAFVINQFCIIEKAVASGEKLIKSELYDIQNVMGVNGW